MMTKPNESCIREALLELEEIKNVTICDPSPVYNFYGKVIPQETYYSFQTELGVGTLGINTDRKGNIEVYAVFGGMGRKPPKIFSKKGPEILEKAVRSVARSCS